MSKYFDKISEVKEKLDDIATLRAKDDMIEALFKTADYLYTHPMDILNGDILIKMGGKLASVYGYISQKKVEARAERDIAENTLKQLEKSLLLDYLSQEQKYKVSEARAKASEDLLDEKEDFILKEARKNQWESLDDMCKTMIMFIQSTLSSKKAESYLSKDSYNNP